MSWQHFSPFSTFSRGIEFQQTKRATIQFEILLTIIFCISCPVGFEFPIHRASALTSPFPPPPLPPLFMKFSGKFQLKNSIRVNWAVGRWSLPATTCVRYFCREMALIFMMQLAAIEMRSPPKKCEDIPRDVEGEKKEKISKQKEQWAESGISFQLPRQPIYEQQLNRHLNRKQTCFPPTDCWNALLIFNESVTCTCDMYIYSAFSFSLFLSVSLFLFFFFFKTYVHSNRPGENEWTPRRDPRRSRNGRFVLPFAALEKWRVTTFLLQTQLSWTFFNICQLIRKMLKLISADPTVGSRVLIRKHCGRGSIGVAHLHKHFYWRGMCRITRFNWTDRLILSPPPKKKSFG